MKQDVVAATTDHHFIGVHAVKKRSLIVSLLVAGIYSRRYIAVITDERDRVRTRATPMGRIMKLLRALLSDTDAEDSLPTTQQHVSIDGDRNVMNVAGRDLIINHLYMMQQQQEQCVEDAVRAINNLMIDIAKSSANIGSYTQEIQIIDAHKDKYLPDELRTRLIRWVDKIEDEVHNVIRKSNSANNHLRSAVQFLEGVTHEMGRGLMMVPFVSYHEARPVIDNLVENERALSNVLLGIKSTTATFRDIASGENGPRRIRVACDSMVRELDDFEASARQMLGLIQQNKQMIVAKLA